MILTGVLLGGGVGCVYYNTFHNCRKAFDAAEDSRTAKRTSRVDIGGYNKAIEKALKVVEIYPNSSYYDDALFVLAVSYYHTGAYLKCERRAREILANYPESEYAGESTLYLAKAKLAQGDLDDAMQVYREIFQQDYKREFKAQAALGLAEFYFEHREYESAQPFLLSLRDSLGNDEERRDAQMMVTSAYFDTYRFADAKSAALQLLGMDPERDHKYQAIKMAAICSYRLQRFVEGHEYLQQLMDDDVYFDSLGSLELLMASGYEDADELVQAEMIYDRLIGEGMPHEQRLQAYWRLGLMYQFDYDDLTMAKEHYDSTSRLGRASDLGKAALQRSSDIGKRESFGRTLTIDSTTTQQAIDEAAYVQFQLSELYWFQLNKPDTAMLEMKYVIDSFPTAYDAPKAMIALAGMVREHEADTARSVKILERVLTRYPTSDYVVEALEALGLRGTAADTGYAGYYFDRAEYYLADEGEIDSARVYYQEVIDRFPDSKHYLQSRFALIWMTEMYNSPGDSSLIFAYNEFVDSFPNNQWADEAKSRTAYRATRRSRDSDEGDTASAWQTEDTTLAGAEDTASYVDPLVAVYVGPNGEAIGNLTFPPIRVDDEFEYPQEAAREGWEGIMYFQVLLDFSGEVDDYIFAIKSPNDEINRRAELAVSTMVFDATRIRTELQGEWMVYKFIVRKPDYLR
jgi:TolA-binding protein